MQVCTLCGEQTLGGYYALPTGQIVQEVCRRCFLLRSITTLLIEAGGFYNTNFTTATLETVYLSLYRDRLSQSADRMVPPPTVIGSAAFGANSSSSSRPYQQQPCSGQAQSVWDVPVQGYQVAPRQWEQLQ